MRVKSVGFRRGSRAGGRGFLRGTVTLVASLAVLASTAAVPASADDTEADDRSALRIGVLAIADAIAAVGRTPELAEPLPFTRTSAADVLRLDDVVTAGLVTAMSGNDSLGEALDLVPGIEVLNETGTRVEFRYEQSVTHELALAYDDGDLRFGESTSAGEVVVTLATPADGEMFVIEVDPDQEDPLLQVALVSEPELELTITGDHEVAGFMARQGFTDVRVTGGTYEVDRATAITLRDPDGRGLLTLEDLRYSTLPDLFRIERTADVVDIGLDLSLPSDVGVTGGVDEEAERRGTMTLARDGVPGANAPVWPRVEDAQRDYGDALAALTGLSLADGMTALAEYTGVALALQDAADVDFPNLGGGTADLFHPGDDLLDMLSTSAVAEIRCGLTPESPPAGVPAPGDTVYCDAVTAKGIGAVTSATWSAAGATVASTTDEQAAAVGATPEGTVQIDASNGQPDVTVTLTTADGTFTARTMPRTIQAVVRRIGELDDAGEHDPASATVNLTDGRLDVDVDLRDASASEDLSIGNPGTLGALVGLTGLENAGPDAKATATATGSSFDVGFGVPFAEPTDEEEAGLEADHAIVLRPSDDSLISIDDLDASAPTGLTDLPGRIGFLGVLVDLGTVGLGRDGEAPVVSLNRSGSGVMDLDDLLSDEGTLEPGVLGLASSLTADISFDATEKAITGDEFASGVAGGASGTATVSWGTSGLPTVAFGGGYDDLRVFDPVPAEFLSGTAVVAQGTQTVTDPDGENPQDVDADTVNVDIAGADLFGALGVPEENGVEVARRLLGVGVGCQNVVLVDADTLTCEGLAPDGVAAFAHGDPVELIVLGDPFALRDGVIEGLAGGLNDFQRLDGDNLPADGLDDDQYTSTLPLVDLTPAQLAVERDAMADGLADLVEAAAEDDSGEKAGSQPPVSSAQELSVAVGGWSTDDGLGYTLGDGQLGITMTSTAPATHELSAPLRFFVDGTGQVVGDDENPVTVDVESTTTLAVDVDVDTARAAMADGSGTTSSASLPTPVNLAGPLRAGVGELTALDADSSATLDVVVETTYDATSGVLETVREDSTGEQNVVAATADLVVTERDENLVYAALPTDSSGGEGAAQPDPEPMQVRFLAEGLDGLGAALGGALDGAAPRNTGESGAPIAAPLIGTDLDAGVDITAQLQGLTSLLRDELETTEVVDAETAAELALAVKAAVKAAVDTDGDAVSGGSATVSVTCGPAGGDTCVTCAEDEEDCETDDGPAAWHTVGVSIDLTGATEEGTTPFEVGLAGLNVRSDQEIDTTTSWTLPVSLELVRGVGPQVTIGADDALALDVAAEIPEKGDVDSSIFGETRTDETCTDVAAAARCLPAIVGYLPAMLTTDEAGGSADLTVKVTPDAARSYDLFALYDGELEATPSFEELGDNEDGLALSFETVASDFGAFDLKGVIDVPWSAADGFGTVEYEEVTLDVGEVIATLAEPFAIVDPYLGPARDVIDVLRTPIPVVSDLSELGGGGEISLLSLLELMGGADKRLELAARVISFIDTAATIVEAIAPFAAEDVPVEELSNLGALVSLDPSDVELASSCTEVVRTSTSAGPTTPARRTKTSAPCPDGSADEGAAEGVRNQTTDEKRKGTRRTNTSVAQTTKSLTGSSPGFSLPFLADPDQIVDVLTGEGEASYFRLDFGSLVAEIAYTQDFGPIMAGPIPIKPFVGGSISVTGRLAVGFDSMPQTLAVRRLAHPGDVKGLVDAYNDFEGDSILEEGFYIDDLDADGVDVPEVKLVTTLEAGAGVSIGIVTAGLKGGIILTINLDLNDPNDDGRLRTAEIRDVFAGNAKCIFDASADIEAFIAVFVEIDLFLTTLEYSFDLLRLGPFELFSYGCPDLEPVLVVQEGDSLALTSGTRSGLRNLPDSLSIAEDYEVRQFDTGGGADGGGTTTYEVSAVNRVQRIEATKDGDGYSVTIYKTAFASSVEDPHTFPVDSLGFLADGGVNDDMLSFLPGETYVDGELVASSFDTPVSVRGNGGNDLLVTGDAHDSLDGGDGDDSMDAGLGDDTILGGSGVDVANGGAGRDDMQGGAGGDRLEGGPGPDRVSGGDGNDAITGGPGRDVRALLLDFTDPDAESVADQVELGFDSGDALIGGAGADMVDGGDGSDVVVGGDASSLTTPAIGGIFVTGTRTVNVLTESPREIGTQEVTVSTVEVPDAAALDTLCVSGEAEGGAGGGDLVTGGPEADVVVGGNGSDDLDGGGGPDEICGLAGDDNISGDGGSPPSTEDAEDADVIRGGHGDDRIEAGAGGDVVFGDDVRLFRDDVRVLDGTVDGSASGAGDDYLDGSEGDDVLGGGGGGDLIVGGEGDDVAAGEGRDTPEAGGDATSPADRLVSCTVDTRVVDGYVDLNGDLLAGPTTLDGVTEDDGRLAGLEVDDGQINALGSTDRYTGLVAGETVVVNGLVDLDRDGTAGNGDTGTIALPSMLGTTSSNGDCILTEEGEDRLFGGTGSDYLGAGDGVDLVDGGDGNDLMLGDAGTDVILGGPHHDVIVGGEGDDHLLGGDGDDRLRGNDGADDLVGGNDASGETDGQDVLLGGRGEDVLAAENATVVSASVVGALTAAVWLGEPGVPDTVKAGEGSGLRFADSAVICGDAEATRWVTLLVGADQQRAAVASPGGDAFYDELYGGYDCDWVFGQDGDDLVRGGQDDDVVEGGRGEDTAYGDEGDDVVIGGSSVQPTTDAPVVLDRSGDGVTDSGDTIYGDNGPDEEVGNDLIAGDNATPVWVPGVARYVIELADVATTTAAQDAALSGGDTIYGGGIAIETEGEDADEIFGQGGGDIIEGGADDDYIEGNGGQDSIGGGAADDDIIGGSSANDGKPLGDDAQRLDADLTALVDDSAAQVLDVRDILSGDSGDDVVLGDNGRITRPGGTLTSVTSLSQAVRTVAMADTSEGTTSGSDELYGGDGDDVVYGQLDDTTEAVLGSGDRIDGGLGADALVGDLAVVTLTPAGTPDTLTSPGDMISEEINLADTLVPVTRVPKALVTVGGSDVVTGGGDDDVLRLGATADVANGDSGDDVVLGGDGDDALWGGTGHDRIFGGYGADDLDLKARTGDPVRYGELDVVGDEDTDDRASTVNGADLVYGGWGADELQADQGGGGPQPGSDQLVDWVGNHNIYYVCAGPYGAGRTIRQSSPTTMSLLTDLVVAAGGTDVTTTGESGWMDLGLVENSHKSRNTKPSPEAPGNFTCEGPG